MLTPCAAGANGDIDAGKRPGTTTDDALKIKHLAAETVDGKYG